MATKMQLAEFGGFPDGMNVNDPPHVLKDTQARMLIDTLIHQSGYTLRRGPLTDVTGMVSFSGVKIVGVVTAIDPSGMTRIGALHTDGTTLKMGVLSTDYSSKVDITLGSTVGTSPYPLIDTSPLLNGGSAIGVATQDGIAPSVQQLIFWRGGGKASYTTGTVTTTYGSTAVTGSSTTWSTNVEAGMFLIDNASQYVGTVQTVNSNTSITLERPALSQLAGTSYTIQALRGFAPIVVQGTLTVGTASTAVTGAGSFFRDEGLANGWKVFREFDGAFVGTVSSVTNNTSLTLTANAAVSMAEDGYYAVNNAGDYGFSITDITKKKPGFLTAVYAGKQWYANRGTKADAGGEWVNRLWFSEDSGPEDIDMALVSGNYLPIVSGQGVNTPIKAIVPAYNSLVVLKEQEAFILVGQSENQFEIKKLGDDGCLSAMSAVSYEGGVIWAGRNGVYFYDGVIATNIVEKTMGLAYKQAVKDFDPSVYRMWGSVVRDHYFLHIERFVSPVPEIKSTTVSAYSEVTLCIYLPKSALTFFKNMNIRGSVNFSAGGGQLSWLAANASGAGHICDYSALFDTEGNDAFACDGGTAGPDFYIESKHYGLGADLLKKAWKQLLIYYRCAGDTLRLDTVLGLNDIGQQSSSVFPITAIVWDQLAATYTTWDSLPPGYPTWDLLIHAIFNAKRIKFLKRNQYFGFRIYQNSGSVTAAVLGSFAIGYKPQRPGRI